MQPVVEPAFVPGAAIGGRYALQRLIGRGGFGEVWVALDRTLGREVALKVLHGELAGDADVAERFEREARVLAELDHPNIARALDFDVSGPVRFIALEYVRGTTLESEIQRRAASSNRFDDREVLEIFHGIAGATAYAHARGIVHRDLKPRNVLLEGGSVERVKVLDFGIAKILGSQGTTAGSVYGSLFYLSPEQAMGGPVTAATDVFALGTMLFELLTLRRAWARDDRDQPLKAAAPLSARDPINNPASVTQRIASEPRFRVTAFRPAIAPEIDAVVERAIAASQAERFQSAAELAEAVERALACELGEPTTAGIANVDLGERTRAEALTGAGGMRFGQGAGTTVGGSRVEAGARTVIDAPGFDFAAHLEPLAARDDFAATMTPAPTRNVFAAHLKPPATRNDFAATRTPALSRNDLVEPMTAAATRLDARDRTTAGVSTFDSGEAEIWTLATEQDQTPPPATPSEWRAVFPGRHGGRRQDMVGLWALLVFACVLALALAILLQLRSNDSARLVASAPVEAPKAHAVTPRAEASALEIVAPAETAEPDWEGDGGSLPERRRRALRAPRASMPDQAQRISANSPGQAQRIGAHMPSQAQRIGANTPGQAQRISTPAPSMGEAGRASPPPIPEAARAPAPSRPEAGRVAAASASKASQAPASAAPESARAPEPAYPKIAALLEQLRAKPDDASLKLDIAREIDREAEHLPEQRKWAVKAAVAHTYFGGDRAALEEAFRVLTKASR